MDSLEIYDQLKHLDCFIGVYPRDIIPEIETYPAAIVFNTDSSKELGTHWIAIYFDQNRKGEYFDSFGLPPLFPEFIDFLNNNSRSWFHNPVTLQSIDSTSCGLYCIKYIQYRCEGKSYCEFIKQFHRNSNINELILNFL